MAKKQIKNHECCICGRKIAREIKLPLGRLWLCTDQDCLDALNYRTNGRSVPFVWFSLDNLLDHEAVNETILKHFKENEKVTQELARQVSDFIWGGETMGELFHDALTEAGKELELKYVSTVDRTELPLISMDNLKTDAAKVLLEKRLKGEKA